MQNRVMFESGRNDMLFALLCAYSGSRQNCLIIGLTATRGEQDLTGLGVDYLCCITARLLKLFFSLLPYHIQARRIAVVILHIIEHNSYSCIAHLSCSGVIRVNLHILSPSVYRIILPLTYYVNRLIGFFGKKISLTPKTGNQTYKNNVYQYSS